MFSLGVSVAMFEYGTDNNLLYGEFIDFLIPILGLTFNEASETYKKLVFFSSSSFFSSFFLTRKASLCFL